MTSRIEMGMLSESSGGTLVSSSSSSSSSDSSDPAGSSWIAEGHRSFSSSSICLGDGCSSPETPQTGVGGVDGGCSELGEFSSDEVDGIVSWHDSSVWRRCSENDNDDDGIMEDREKYGMCV